MVCLSLLNTWKSRENEVWDPNSSSILQVLQGLVLNSKPYFNEAGYDTVEGALGYNENTLLLNCKTMMYLMRKPPKVFEELIKEHFRKRGYYILTACDAYMKRISDRLVRSPKIVPKLFSALSDIGAFPKHLQKQ